MSHSLDILALICVVAKCVFVDTAALTKEAVVCEGETFLLQCDNNETVIYIEDAYYGRRNTSACTDESLQLKDVDCTNVRSLPTVWNLCQQKHSCLLAAKNEVFGSDPCPKLRKYLSVTYKCDKEGVDTIGECPYEFWYPWLDGDSPSGTGDYETFYRHRWLLPEWCSRPAAVQIQLASGESYLALNEVLQTGIEHGVSCINSHQQNIVCSNYKVRFCCPTECAVEITDQERGEISSPNYPANYDPNTDCSWIIKTSFDRFLSFDIFFVELERQKKCGFDYLEIVDLEENEIAFHGCKLNTNMTRIKVSGNSAQVRFISDDSNEGQGFSLNWKSVKIPACTKPEPPLFGSITPTDQILWKVGSVVTYHCNTGYLLSGESSAQCRPDKQWSQHRPLCKANCASAPLNYFQRLPDYCTEADGSQKFVNTGKCSRKSCENPNNDSNTPFCCEIGETEINQVDCGTFTLPTTRIIKCTCGPCISDEIAISGIAFSGNEGNPLQFGSITYDGKVVADTDEKGHFLFNLKHGRHQTITLTFVDATENKYLNKIKVIDVVQNEQTFLKINMTKKPTPVVINSKENSTIVLQAGPSSDDDHKSPFGEVHIVSDSITDENGNQYTGEVEVSIQVLDGEDPFSWNEAPGPFLGGTGEDDGPGLLENYGIFQFHVSSPENDPLEVKNMEIQVDASHIADEAHLKNMRIWSFSDSQGIWEDEGPMEVYNSETPSDEKVFLIGNINVTVNRIWSLNVLLEEYCYAKVRAYDSSKFDHRDQIDGISVQAVYMSNIGIWKGYSAEVTEGGNGACVMVPCEGSSQTVRLIHFTATGNEDENLWAVSSDPFNPKIAGFNKFIRDLLKYRRSDHKASDQPKTAFNITLTKKYDAGSKWYGPIYPAGQSDRCFLAPDTDSHFRFYRKADFKKSAIKNEYSVISSLGNVSDPRYWGPEKGNNRVCFIKVAVLGVRRALIRATSSGGIHSSVKSQLYGYRQKYTAGDEALYSVCLEFKCSKYMTDGLLERTLVSIKSMTHDCKLTDVNPLLHNYLSFIKPSRDFILGDNQFLMLSPTSPLGSDFGIYTVERNSFEDSKKEAESQCREGSSFRQYSGKSNTNNGTAFSFECK